MSSPLLSVRIEQLPRRVERRRTMVERENRVDRVAPLENLSEFVRIPKEKTLQKREEKTQAENPIDQTPIDGNNRHRLLGENERRSENICSKSRVA